MSGSIDDMLAIFRKCSTGRSSFTVADHFIFKWLACFGHFADEYLITQQSFFGIGSLKDDPLAIKTEVSFSIVTSESKLLNIAKMCFFGIENGISREA
jgi:hypothetical protein